MPPVRGYELNGILCSSESLLDRDGQILHSDELFPWTAVTGWEASHIKHFRGQFEGQINDTMTCRRPHQH